MQAIQDEEEIHYSSGIPSKNIQDYEELVTFHNFIDLQKWLSENRCNTLNTEEFKKAENRDVFGDFVIQLEDEDFDYAVRQAGDFMLYFNSDETGEIKKLLL